VTGASVEQPHRERKTDSSLIFFGHYSSWKPSFGLAYIEQGGQPLISGCSFRSDQRGLRYRPSRNRYDEAFALWPNGYHSLDSARGLGDCYIFYLVYFYAQAKGVGNNSWYDKGLYSFLGGISHA